MKTTVGLRSDVAPHLLRYTYASELADYGYSPKEIQTLMGHSDAKISLDICAHKEAEDIDAEKGNGALTELLRVESEDSET